MSIRKFIRFHFRLIRNPFFGLKNESSEKKFVKQIKVIDSTGDITLSSVQKNLTLATEEN